MTCEYGHPDCDGEPMTCLVRESEDLGLYDVEPLIAQPGPVNEPDVARLRALIRKYVLHVVDVEGVDFIDHMGHEPETDLTPAEREELREISGRAKR